MRSPIHKPPKISKRVDLSKRILVMLLSGLLILGGCIFFIELSGLYSFERPGMPLHQASGIVGFFFLLVPVVFSLTKRSGLATNPPKWFVSHVLCGSLGGMFILFHAVGGNLVSIPGVILCLLIVLVGQGFISRAFLSDEFSHQFGSRAMSFKRPDQDLQQKLRSVVDEKIILLKRIDPKADEALFSVNLIHWFRVPILSYRYVKLAQKEASLVGARRLAGPKLSRWRKIHISLGILFVLGMCAHVLVVTFFAGYASGSSEIYWWHVSDWGAEWSYKP
ncbi:hypothetical protein RYZ26_17940 [Terasakiella sp. A23]|uniref:hypothetical protein n=1 Tax=Terasakiella sp. FCG-A23 TaxID=3080561 RepID=UPI002955BDCD|nr:hypothetical protein [Terasakiella sp. A23]MDV7341496.1 hypothetical protein [Terasakiella sp. A23]